MNYFAFSSGFIGSKEKLGVYDDNNGLDKMKCKSDLELWGRDFTPTNEKLDTPNNNKKKI
jgi:hypothetical protein